MYLLAVTSGGFDPLHGGHIDLINDALHYDYGDDVGVVMGVAIVNTDAWLTRKKGKPFMTQDERAKIVGSLLAIDEVITDHDDSDGTVCDALRKLRSTYPEDQYRIVFCNGGDRREGNAAETSVPGIEFRYGVGGDHKANSSSWLLEKWESKNEDQSESPT